MLVASLYICSSVERSSLSCLYYYIIYRYFLSLFSLSIFSFISNFSSYLLACSRISAFWLFWVWVSSEIIETSFYIFFLLSCSIYIYFMWRDWSWLCWVSYLTLCFKIYNSFPYLFLTSFVILTSFITCYSFLFTSFSYWTTPDFVLRSSLYSEALSFYLDFNYRFSSYNA